MRLTLERVARSVVLVLCEREEDNELVGVATGVLVRIGGREFVLSAGHNLWSNKLGRDLAIAVGSLPFGATANMGPGDGSARRGAVPKTRDANGDPDPDVAVIELSPKAVLTPDREPFEEDCLGYLRSDAPPEQLALSGFPRDKVLPQERTQPGDSRRRWLFDFHLSNMLVWSMPERRWPEEPPQGRGVHVFLSPTGSDLGTDETADIPAPHGMSGGPLVRIVDGRCILVGLARGRRDHLEGSDEWCEPVVEAVRLLVWHQDPDVALAARGLVRRLEDQSK